MTADSVDNIALVFGGSAVAVFFAAVLLALKTACGNRKPLDSSGRSPHTAHAQRRDSRRGSLLLTAADVARLSAQARQRHQHDSLSEEDTSDVSLMKEKFVMAARVVRRLCQVALCMRKYAEGQLGKPFEFVSKQHYRVATKEGEGGGDQELSFDPGFFKMDSEYMFPESAKRVAEKQQADRTPADLRLIGAALRSLGSFRKYPRKSRTCSVESSDTRGNLGVNRVVIKKGHPGTAFYMVFSGRVGVVTTDDPDELMQRASMVVLSKGAIFGEMSLITGKPRESTIRTQEQAELIVVDIHNLQDTELHARLKQDFKSKFDFFRQLELFSQWNDEAVVRLASLARTQACVHGKVVVRDMAEEPTVVFVAKGMCSVVKLLDLSNASKQMEQNVPTQSSVSPSSRLRTTSATTRRFKPLEERPFPPLRPQTVPSTERRTFSESRKKNVSGLARSKSATVGGKSRGGRNNSVKVRPLLSFSDIPLPSHLDERESDDDIDGRSRASSQRKYSRRISHCEQRVGTFMTLGSLEPGKTFGLAHISDAPIPSHLSLVSRGASILHVTLRDFRAVSEGQPALKGLEEENVKVPAERDLCERFFQESQWESYKRHVVEQTMVDIHRPKDGLGLRNYDVIDTYPTSEDILVIEGKAGRDMPFRKGSTGGTVRQRSRKDTPLSWAARRRLGSEYIASPVYARDNRGDLRLIDGIRDRSCTPSRNQYGLKCHHFLQDGS
ncbi:CNBD2 [Branchiostoma lanceolatum]|uniref:CNBD2 protein n=1 Tax=Branchiostoma lanceolatum TaxID=7740 RepID=A0A8J9YUI8_BRALA|nr:CNBD2 [Branchiostoma lanceolatum]